MWSGRAAHALRSPIRVQHAGREFGRGGHFSTRLNTAIFGSRVGWGRDLDHHVAQPVIAHGLPAESGRCRGGDKLAAKLFLDFAQRGQNRRAGHGAQTASSGATMVPIFYADIARGAWVAELPLAASMHQPLPTIVSAQRVAAGCR